MKNLDLNAMGVEEMTEKEVLSVDGGCGGLCLLGVGLIIAAATTIMQEWDDFEKGFNGEPANNNNNKK